MSMTISTVMETAQKQAALVKRVLKAVLLQINNSIVDNLLLPTVTLDGPIKTTIIYEI
jgi:hypothetical protein